MAQVARMARHEDFQRDRLKEIIREHSFRRGSFKLASGRVSEFFFDLKPTMLDPEGIDLLADMVLERTAHLSAKYIGGLVMGAVPIIIGTVLKSRLSNRPLRGFWVRKEQKDHGKMNLTDGHIVDGEDVIIVDDVTTTGGSVLQAINEIKRHNCKVSAVITVVDRLEGAKENLAKEGIELIALFTTVDF
jgi:orotate phosphoribosyltransferase